METVDAESLQSASASPVEPVGAGSGEHPTISGPLRPANEALLEQIAPTSAVLRRRAFAAMLRVLLAGKVD